MKTLGMIILVFTLSCHPSKAQDTLYIYKSGSILAKYAVASFDSIIFHNAISPTIPGKKVTDIDGNIYNTVSIGTQIWMVENLKTTRYSNGNAIVNITDATAWSNLTTGAYSNYNNDKNNSSAYGRLYNWFAVNDSCNICPTGFHVPTE